MSVNHSNTGSFMLQSERMGMYLGLLSEDEYIRCVKDLHSKSEALQDGWNIMHSRGKTYMSKKSVISLRNICSDIISTSAAAGAGISDAAEMILDEEDNATLNKNEIESSNAIIHLEYNVVYSESYSVPVLYFNIYYSDGRLLSLNEVWQLVPEYYRERLIDDKWTFLTQAEHPLHGRPFYQLHPCNTELLMSNVAKLFKTTMSTSCKGHNYLICWLCTVGPVVLLKMPMEYGIVI